MLTILHVLVAVTSLGIATINHVKPAKTLLRASYILAGGTLSSGVMLIVFNHASIIRTCSTGIAFFGVVWYLNKSAHTRISAAQQKND